MKKIITLILSLTIAATIFGGIFPVEARVLSDTYADQAALLKTIGLLDSVSESEAQQTLVTRGEFAQYMENILHMDEATEQNVRYFTDVPMDHWAVSAINRLTEMGVISVGTDQKFRPGDKITENEATKMVLTVAGYGEYSQVRGGYPAGYFQTAKELKLSVSGSEEPLTLARAAQLLYEILQVPVYMGTKYSDDHVIEYGSADETLLSLYYDMYAMEGIVTYADGIDLDGKGVEEKNIIRVGGVSYKTELHLMQEVGRFSSFICRESEGDMDEIVLLNTEKKRDKMVEFYSEDFVEYRSGENTVVYYGANEKELRAKLAKNVVVVKNGKLMDENTAEAFEINKGQIRLTDINQDGAFDYVVIFAYENYIADTFDEFSSVLYDVLDSSKSISINPAVDSRKIRIQDTAGREMSFSDIPVGSVLSVCESEDFVLATVSVNQITGTIFQIAEGEESIPKLLIGKNKSDTQWYQMDRDYYQAEYGDAVSLSIGISGTYYLDFRGKIAMIESASANEWQYAYLVAHAFDTLFTPELKLKLFLQTGEMKVCKVSDKVKVDGNTVKGGDAALYAISKERYGKVLAKNEDPTNGQLLRIKFNSNGIITDIDTEYTAPSAEGAQSLKRTANVQTLYYRYHAGSFNGQFVRNSQTVYFGVPTHENLKTANDKEFRILPSGWFGDKNYTVEGFKLDQRDGYESAIVCYGISTDTIEEGYYLVEYASDAVNAEGNRVKMLHVWSCNGIESDLRAAEEFDFSITEEKDGVVNVYTADEGDIIRIGRDVSGDINSIEMIYDYSRRNDSDYSITWNAHVSNNYYREKGNLMHGYIKSFRDGVLRVSWNKPTREEYENNPQKADYVAPKQNGAVLIFDPARSNNKIYFGSNADLISADKLGEEAEPYFLYMTVGIFRGAILYR